MGNTLVRDLQAAHRVYNVDKSYPGKLLHLVGAVQYMLVEEGVLSADYDSRSHNHWAGHVPVTHSDNSVLECDFNYNPSLPLQDGLGTFDRCYRKYYEIQIVDVLKTAYLIRNIEAQNLRRSA